ncbi:hypothetical protein SDC9_103207 [bioreactor metagenome]|uniref:HNH nuclease domain-containing protein n=1 Tax=bioreactor metagenome TaxID=1076179 RepID=A0A645B3V4_9ZZZZ|nr:HNH endonuclease domain-containing protein [Candidatus Pelethousia sp.]
MIPVTMQPEPSSFDADVRQRGNAFLTTCPTPTNKLWPKHAYWKYASDDLYRAYGGICAYTGEWFSRTSTSVSVDHFIPKSINPNLAYEWSNYRLTTQKANGNKANQTGIADPFSISSGWFVLDLPSCLIVPGKGLSPAEYATVQRTINVLRLNEDDEYVQGRCNIILYYIKGDITLNYMWDKYPFIAHELTRQSMIDGVKQMFKTLA